MKRMNVFILALVIVALLVLLLPLAGWYRLHKTLNHRVSPNTELESQYSLPKKSVQFTTLDGLKIAGWYIPVENPKAVVILVHGRTEQNGGKPLMLGHAQYLHEAGYSTLLVDLRGVGESDGERIYLGVKEWQDLEAAYDYAKSLPQNKDRKVGYLGISMGASTSIVATGLTGKGDFVIASVPYIDLLGIFKYRLLREGIGSKLMVPFIAPVALLEFGFDYAKYTPREQITNIKAPVFIIAAKNDESISPEGTKQLFELGNDPKEYWEPDTGHDVFKALPEEFKTRVLDFLDKYVVTD